MTLKERIAFYNKKAANNNNIESQNNKPPIITPKKIQYSPLPQTVIQKEELFLESRNDAEQQQRPHSEQYTNDRKLETDNQNQYSDDDIEQINDIEQVSEIEKESQDDTENNSDQVQEQSTVDESEDDEQLEKQYEEFQNFMSDFSDDNDEEDKNDTKKANTEDEEEDNEEDSDKDGENLGSFVALAKNLSNITRNLLGNLKNYIKVDLVLQRLQIDQSSTPKKLINILIDNYNYDDGIVYTASDSSKIKKATTNNAKDGANNNESNKSRSNLFKLMTYDEQIYCWHFDESKFKQIIKDNKSNPIIPLFLFIDTKMDDIKKISSVVRKDNLEYKLEDEEEISVYAFWKDSLNFMEYDREKRFENKITDQLFLYVYVPENKEKHKNIGAILFQIYVFLFIICDLSIIMIDDQHQKMQILFLKEVIKISRLYSNELNHFYDKSRILFLQLNQKNKNEELEKIIEKNIGINHQINLMKNVKEFDLILKGLYFQKCYSYSKLVETLNHINSLFSQLSSLYIYMRKEVINKQQSGQDIKTIIENSYKYFPKNDEYVNRVFDMVVLDMNIESNQKKKKN